MKVLKLFLLMLLLLVPFMLQAKGESNTTTKVVTQKVTKEEGSKKDALKAAQELFSIMHLKDIYAKIVDDATNSLVRRAPQLKSVQKKIHDYYNRYIGWDAIKDEMAKIYAKYYSAKELEELVKFYKTDLGKKTLATLPKISAEGRSLGINRMREHQKELQDIIQKVLEPKEKEAKAK